MNAQVMQITPEIAKGFLEKNSVNRLLRNGHIKYLQHAMETGNWIPSNQSIGLSTTGELIDGQHRCSAIINSGRTIEMVVVHDVSPLAFKVIDSGVGRQLADRVSYHPDKAMNAAITSTYVSLAKLLGILSTNHKTAVADTDIIHDEYGVEVSNVVGILKNAKNKPKWCISTMFRAAVALYWRVDPDKAADFLQKSITGVNLAHDNPVRQFRESLSGHYNNLKGTPYAIAYKTYWAIGKHYRGEKATCCRSAQTPPIKAYQDELSKWGSHA